MRTETKRSKAKIKDEFIREVNVHYRMTEHRGNAMTEPDQVAQFFRTVTVDNSREHFAALYLDGASHVVCYSIISIGTANSTLVSPREVFQRAVLVGAVSVLVAHNHPSGKLVASDEDIQTTRRLKGSGELIGVRLLDHVIVSDTSYLSLRHTLRPW